MKTLRKDSNELSLLIFNKSLPYRWEQKRKKENKHNLPLLNADKSTLKKILTFKHMNPSTTLEHTERNKIQSRKLVSERILRWKF